MIKALYLSCLIFGVVVLISAILTIAGIMVPVDENSGNAGAFTAFLSIGVGVLSIVLLTALGIVGTTVGCLYEDNLPPGLLYKYWWPALLAVPGTMLLILLAGKTLINGF